MQTKFRLTRLALSFWASRTGLQAWGFSLLVILCTVILVSLNLMLNQWQGDFYNQLQQYNFSGFIDTLVQFLLIAGIYIVISGHQVYFRLILQLRWRQHLTGQYIHRWLYQRTYYHLNILGSAIDNPAQRISEDINLFVDNTLDLVTGLLRHTVTLAMFSVVLWQLSGTIRLEIGGYGLTIAGYLVWAAFVYSLAGTWITVRVGRPLIMQSVVQQSAEAEFRSRLDRIREHDECIILYGGETKEKTSLACHFQKIAANCLQIAKSTKTLTLLTAAYAQISVVFAFLMAAPRYFNHEIQLGQLFEISGAYWYVHSALSYIVDSFRKIALWKALMHRLDGFSSAMAEVQARKVKQGSIVEQRNPLFRVTGLTIVSLSGEPLIKNLSFALQHTDRLLISGPAGSGKTTLFRTLAGIWPNFSGQIAKPAEQYAMFLPQTPYFPIDSLRNVLLYPQITNALSAEQLNSILTVCNLPKLTGKLNRLEDWSKVLSAGEQQCLSIARAILHQPEWLFLDEATSSLDKATEQHIFDLLRKTMPATALISIGHQDALRPYHTLNLMISGNGSWQLVQLKK
ncbi:ABC transporter ATP-binding protein/permease|uniref:Putative ATP-binding cassette transporter n=1 Tax=Dendrosporobacter quercicolus TaxID=146817 RepID=A0A1G9QUL8_9FIRM|nr:ABC transporter ATP-binding protein/permease [Dendrosporobacter quercicolus]NSL48357.1 ABC transporter ATP-binding protein/permease [Dendrosporobacter quercicolus DSM 1736]SDM14297.1 putative ATP-binding cassette transporter [Dendrosporobacter quercicolus]